MENPNVGLAEEKVRNKHYTRTCLRRGKNLGLSWEDARDAYANSVRLAYENNERILNVKNPDAYFSKIFRSQCCANRVKRRDYSVGKYREIKISFCNNPQTPLENLIAQESLDVFNQVFQTLPCNYQFIISQRYFSDLSTKQIAEKLGVSSTTVRKRLKEAEEKLKKSLVRKLSDGI